MKKILIFTTIYICLLTSSLFPQGSSTSIPPMVLDVGNIHLKMDKKMGNGGLQTQFSWLLADDNAANNEIFYWPRDEWQSNMLYQIFNPICLDENGIIDENGIKKPMVARGNYFTNYGLTDWALETRRYRPPKVIVDGYNLTSPCNWKIDPNLKSDIKIEFEDVLPQFGIRSHIEIYGFSNPYLSDFFIWKATHKFTGEITTPDDTINYSTRLPDQTIKFWWPIEFSFGPSKAGDKITTGEFGHEGLDDLDSWFKNKSDLVTDGTRDSLYIAYYWDADNERAIQYSHNPSLTDDTGDPGITNGHLYSTQIPGYALLYADKSSLEKVDDPQQPYSLPHASIVEDLWARRDTFLRLTYRGDDNKGRFPLDIITEGFYTTPQKGPMRFITVGPYELTKNTAQDRYDSLTFVYAIGVGSIGWEAADSVGKLWFNGQITNEEKNAWVRKGKDSLWQAIDRAYWSWNRLSKNQTIPSPPPPPDLEVTSDSTAIRIKWSYPDSSYFRDAETGIDDWYAWRVYRKKGRMMTNDPEDNDSGERWQKIFETTNRNIQSFIDNDAKYGNTYSYAVTAIDDGSQNSSGLFTGYKFESSRFTNMTRVTASVLTGVKGNNASEYKFSLEQNFPNPFNPSTKINYQIPQTGFVTLKVYDLLGREVTMLVNEEKAAGNYEVNFNADKLSSGVYFYKLQTGNYIETRKMVLLR